MVSVEEAKEYIERNATFSYSPTRNKWFFRLDVKQFTYMFCDDTYDKIMNALIPIVMKRMN
jgi:hypothetical protein